MKVNIKTLVRCCVPLVTLKRSVHYRLPNLKIRMTLHYLRINRKVVGVLWWCAAHFLRKPGLAFPILYCTYMLQYPVIFLGNVFLVLFLLSQKYWIFEIHNRTLSTHFLSRLHFSWWHTIGHAIMQNGLFDSKKSCLLCVNL